MIRGYNAHQIQRQKLCVAIRIQSMFHEYRTRQAKIVIMKSQSVLREYVHKRLEHSAFKIQSLWKSYKQRKIKCFQEWISHGDNKKTVGGPYNEQKTVLGGPYTFEQKTLSMNDATPLLNSTDENPCLPTPHTGLSGEDRVPPDIIKQKKDLNTSTVTDPTVNMDTSIAYEEDNFFTDCIDQDPLIEYIGRNNERSCDTMVGLVQKDSIGFGPDDDFTSQVYLKDALVPKELEDTMNISSVTKDSTLDEEHNDRDLELPVTEERQMRLHKLRQNRRKSANDNKPHKRGKGEQQEQQSKQTTTNQAPGGRAVMQQMDLKRRATVKTHLYAMQDLPRTGRRQRKNSEGHEEQEMHMTSVEAIKVFILNYKVK